MNRDQEWAKLLMPWKRLVRILKLRREANRARRIRRLDRMNFRVMDLPSSGPKKISVMAPITNNTPK